MDANKPDETGRYIHDTSIEVNVWVKYVGRCHGSYDYYDVFIQTTEGKFIKRFTDIYSQIPAFTIK